MLRAVAASLLAVAAAAPAQVLVIRHATVIDVAAGRAIPNQAVAVSGDTIRAVGSDKAIARRYPRARQVDARGKFVMPGLWDMHMHFGGGAELIEENRSLLPLYVANGVTAVRDAAADISLSVLEWRSAVAKGKLLGPTIFTSGPKLEGYKPLWKGTIEVGTPAEVDAALDRLQAMKVDFVKITDNTLKPDIFLYAVTAAKKRGLKTSAHTPFALTIQQAADAGLSSIEHIDYLIKAGSPREAEIGAAYAAGKISYGDASDAFTDSFDARYAAGVYRRLAKTGISVTPTLNMGRILAYLDKEDHSSDPGLAYMGPGLRKTYDWRIERAAKSTPAQVAERHKKYELSVRVLPMLVKAGIPILAGTDAGYLNSFNYPGWGLHDELELYEAAGLTPRQVLESAVLTGPRFLGHADRYGSVSPGKVADMLILDANPLRSIKAARAIHAVVLKGRLLDRTALDAMLAEAKRKAVN
jgi:imidazolonepropionase-like amidohydrolase